MARKKTEQPADTQQDESEEVMARPGLKIPELEVFKKISMLSSLAQACEDADLVKVFSKMKHGDELYEIFVKAVHQEIEGVISGKEQEAVKQMASVRDMASGVYDMVQTMYNMMAATSNSPIMKVLAIVHDRMTGSSFEDVLARSVAAQRFNQSPEAQYQATQAAQAALDSQPMAPAPQSQAPSNNPPLTKKYADGRGAAPSKYANDPNRPPAPTIPPRGRNIEGIF